MLYGEHVALRVADYSYAAIESLFECLILEDVQKVALTELATLCLAQWKQMDAFLTTRTDCWLDSEQGQVYRCWAESWASAARVFDELAKAGWSSEPVTVETIDGVLAIKLPDHHLTLPSPQP